MTKLSLPLRISGILSLLYGVVTLSPSLASSIFAYDVRDLGLLSIMSALFLSLGVITLAAASNSDRYGGLASAFALAHVIAAVVLAWKWAAGVFTARNALVSLILEIVLAVWLWSARPKTYAG
jgi:hypothetical protein